MVKTPCYIARYPGDERVERQRQESRRRFLITVNKQAKGPVSNQDKGQ